MIFIKNLGRFANSVANEAINGIVSIEGDVNSIIERFRR